jgi:oxygen-independent coproporphyrinogen-3 oxidase
MGFRYIEGPDEILFQHRFGRKIGELIPKTMSAWRERGLMLQDKAAFTKEGLLFLDAFLIDAFGELG